MMTATCREACCSLMPRLTVSELFERGFRRNRTAPLSIQGTVFTDSEGNSARFSLDLDGCRIAKISFNATSCATLIAYCELIAETLPGMRPEIARALAAEELVETLPGVPATKHARAVLAISALRAALASIPDNVPNSGENHDESRLHFCNPTP